MLDLISFHKSSLARFRLSAVVFDPKLGFPTLVKSHKLIIFKIQTKRAESLLDGEFTLQHKTANCTDDDDSIDKNCTILTHDQEVDLKISKLMEDAISIQAKINDQSKIDDDQNHSLSDLGLKEGF